MGDDDSQQNWEGPVMLRSNDVVGELRMDS